MKKIEKLMSESINKLEKLKEEKIETADVLEYLAPYLPYELKCNFYVEDYPVCKNIILNTYNINQHPIKQIKPILRPLHDLLKGDKLTLELSRYIIDKENYSELNIMQWNFLFRNHFDIFSLIKKGLAIDINTSKL